MWVCVPSKHVYYTQSQNPNITLKIIFHYAQVVWRVGSSVLLWWVLGVGQVPLGLHRHGRGGEQGAGQRGRPQAERPAALHAAHHPPGAPAQRTGEQHTPLSLWSLHDGFPWGQKLMIPLVGAHGLGCMTTSQTDPPPSLHKLGANWRPWHLIKVEANPKRRAAR